MVTVFDVAQYILQHHAPMSAMKLQKLVYYAQAWSLVWDEKPLFDEKIEAWANGPVCRKLYAAHAKQFMLSKTTDLGGDASKVTGEERRTVDAVIEAYGGKSAHFLSALTHEESPWRMARGDAQPGEASRAEITHASMAEFYEGLASQGKKR